MQPDNWSSCPASAVHRNTAYFVSARTDSFVHGRMPSIAAARMRNRGLTYVGVSGDGDSLSIGIGQLVHVIRRNLNMLYLIENNGVYGLPRASFRFRRPSAPRRNAARPIHRAHRSVLLA